MTLRPISTLQRLNPNSGHGTNQWISSVPHKYSVTTIHGCKCCHIHFAHLYVAKQHLEHSIAPTVKML